MQTESDVPPFRKPVPKRIWTFLFMLFIFICGGVAGGGLAVKFIVTRTQEAIQSPSSTSERFTRRLTRMLDLDEKQQQQVAAIVSRNLSELAPVRAEIRSRLLLQLQTVQKELEPILTAEQKEKLEQRLLRIEKRWLRENPAQKP